MKSFFFIIITFVTSWCVFAVYDFSSNEDTLIVYELIETKDSELSNLGYPMYGSPYRTEYRISKGNIISKTGILVREYENCIIFDVNNWRCTLGDASSTFGAGDGKFFQVNNIVKFPSLVELKQQISVSRLHSILNRCETSFFYGFWSGLLECSLAPFYF